MISGFRVHGGFSELIAQLHHHVGNLWLRLGWFTLAANAFGRVVRHRPTNTHALFYRGWALSHLGKHSEAISCFEQLLPLQRSPAALHLLGCSLQAESRHKEAIDAFREAIRLEPSSDAFDDVYYNLGVSLTAVRLYGEAVAAFEQAASVDPAETDSWESLGFALVKLGRWKDAVSCLERVMRRAPSVPSAAQLALTLIELQRFEDAEDVVRRALQIEPGAADMRAMLAMVMIETARYEEAIRLATEACEIDPLSVYARCMLAGALAEGGRLPEARRAATMAIELEPGYAEAYGTLGGVLLKEQNGIHALANFERAIELHASDEAADRAPGGAWVRFMAGRAEALSLLGRHAEALEIYAAVLDADPTFLERNGQAAETYRTSQRIDSQSRDGP